MEKQYQILNDGQELSEDDLESIGEQCGLADDRVFAEFLRMPVALSTQVARCVIPYTENSMVGDFRPYFHTLDIVRTNGASGKVRVNPIRAYVGSRTLVASDPKENWRDIRSAVLVGSTTLHTEIALSANSSGNARWDLVYAVISPDANEATVSRKVKNPSTGVITSVSVSVNKVTSISVSKVTGTPSGTPALPTLPADGGGNYYIPLAYVRVPNGFNASSTVLSDWILHQAPHIPISHVTGVATAMPASSNREVVTAVTDSTTLTTTRVATWGSTGTKPNYYLPPQMLGEETIWIAIDATDASAANWSHADESVVDDSRTWENRVFTWQAFCNVGDFAWTFPGNDHTPSAVSGSSASGFGQSFEIDTTTTTADGMAIMIVDNTTLPGLGSGRTVKLYIDSNGDLAVTISGQLDSKLFVRLTASPMIFRG